MPAQETILVELLIRLEGSDITNRITTFEMPVIRLSQAISTDEPGQVRVDGKTLKKSIITAVRDLV